MSKTAIITGASEGLGLSFANCLAGMKYNLMLISRDFEKLASVKQRIEAEYRVDVNILSLDLTSDDAVDTILNFLNENQIIPNIIINNAGIGFKSEFSDMPKQKIREIIYLNIRFIIEFTHAILPFIENNSDVKILNIASTLGLRTSPNWALYAASKAMIISWSRSLSSELKRKGIILSIGIPGKIDTDFDKKANNEYLNAPRKANPDKVARVFINGLMNSRKIIFSDISVQIKYFMFKLLPESIILFIAGKN